MAKKINFLDVDGHLNTKAYVELTREMDKILGKEGFKCTEIYFAPKVIPVFDKAKAKSGGDAFTKKRAVLVKMKKRMPPAGSRMRMVVMLKNWKGIEDTDFADDFNAALKAIEQHNKAAEKFITKHKAAGAKAREQANKEFDKNLDCFLDEVLPEDCDFAIGQSMMGKTVIIKLPNGGYLSVGKSDKAKFEAAQASSEDKEEKPVKSKKMGAKTKKVAKDEAPAKTKKVKKAAKPEAPVKKKVRR